MTRRQAHAVDRLIVPVVAVPALGTRDVLVEGEGALTAPAAAAPFAAAVERLLLDEPLRRELGRRGREYAQRWSNTAMCGRLVGVYDSVIDRAAEGTPALDPA